MLSLRIAWLRNGRVRAHSAWIPAFAGMTVSLGLAEPINQ
jgi:hypothetical protein